MEGLSESQEQIYLFQWAELNRRRMPELGLLFHVPNGGKRSMATARRLKAEGVKAGVPDLCLPVARGGWHGLFIELKRAGGGRATEQQREWIGALEKEGYRAVVCHGWEAAAEELARYLEEKSGEW